MREFLKRQWFLTTLGALLAAGMFAGLSGNAPRLAPVANVIKPQLTTAFVLFLMSFSLNSDHLWAAVRSPRPVVLGYVVNFGLVPLLAWALVPLQQSADFRCGLMIAACVPCTTAAASVMTRKAGGNDAVSLLTTLATNLSCWLLTPLWLHYATATTITLPTGTMMLDLLQTVLVPTLAGQLLRQPAPLKLFAVRRKTPISVAAQVLIELMVFTAALKAGQALHEMRAAPAADSQHSAHAAVSDESAVAPARSARISTAALSIVWGSCVAVHVAGLGLGWSAARRLGVPVPEAIATAFSGSQKTLPIGLWISTDPTMYGANYPFAMFPMLLFHASQLFLDTVIAARLAARPTATGT